MSDRFSSADAAWLNMDRPTNLMVINSVLLFDEPVDWERAKLIAQRRLVDVFPRFRQRVVESRLPLRPPSWVDDPDFALEHHMHHLALPAPSDRAALQALVSDLMTMPLDRSRPLWHSYLVDGFGEGAAIISRMHHCIADGIALGRVMMSLTDSSADADVGPPPVEPERLDTGLLGGLAGSAAQLALVPYNLRPLDEPVPRKLGNKFGLVFLPLPVGTSGSYRRLVEVHRRMQEIKSGRDGEVSYGLLSLTGLVPKPLERRIIDMFTSKSTAVITNVPGPRKPVYHAGKPLRSVLFWAPTSGHMGMSVSIYSYRGEVTIGLMVDATLVPDPEQIVTQLERELDALARLSPGRTHRPASRSRQPARR